MKQNTQLDRTVIFSKTLKIPFKAFKKKIDFPLQLFIVEHKATHVSSITLNRNRKNGLKKKITLHDNGKTFQIEVFTPKQRQISNKSQTVEGE